MIRGHTARAVREAEAPLLAAGQTLMLRAARALADRVHAVLEQAGPAPEGMAATQGTAAEPRVLVLAGAGANGGDGLHAAAMLRAEGVAADALTTAAHCHEEGAAALRTAGGTLRAHTDLDPDALAALLARTDLVLDAILGLGGRPSVPGPLIPLLTAVREATVPVLAVDLPSFVDATTGQAAPQALPARETVTFGAVKAGLLLGDGAELAGALHLVDLGLAPHLPATPAVLRCEDADVRALLPRPGRDASKYTRGVVALAAGSDRFPGAAVLAASGAARAGAGMVRCLAPQAVLDLVLHARPEVVGHRVERALGGPDAVDLAAVGRTDALVVGPGLPPEDPRAGAGVDCLRRDPGPADGPRGHLARGVLDAGALSLLTPAQRFGPDVVLTPHRGEAERLAQRLEIDPALPGPALATALAAATGATVLLKGALTVIAPGDGGPLRSQDDATAQLASAGTGDVLAGVLGTLLAAGLPGPDAAAVAALLHGRAGRAASAGGVQPLLALDVATALPTTIGTILAGGQT
ncbi:NAD(P)H-hydrate dehydratase [Brachybacterium saurashtrense]|uniref:Bifunctional NAD(P)H-hydrate repair enzyme n=1 Tax=Brachybacterium saurashtrense TaxID=556288 RepID=A0A345YP92_9MICO|nr:NAD(P)H-hydrate dehydratase [Brachybacterium saurashtrense]AXK45744.1 NAD(P)H-hydrate dehydratase [Brachybacterium saurashtrense]RRR24762.1 NAD(P)H-hydrate dehydratase [Brachybacterium saurashtrense]